MAIHSTPSRSAFKACDRATPSCLRLPSHACSRVSLQLRAFAQGGYQLGFAHAASHLCAAEPEGSIHRDASINTFFVVMDQIQQQIQGNCGQANRQAKLLNQLILPLLDFRFRHSQASTRVCPGCPSAQVCILPLPLPPAEKV